MRLAILGATSQIAKDLIRCVVAENAYELILYARDCDSVRNWLKSFNLPKKIPVFDYREYGVEAHDVVINFIGVGDPARAAAMGRNIFDITLQYDQMVLDELIRNPFRRYFFLSSGAVYGNTFLQPADAYTKATISINDLAPQEYYAAAKLHSECRHRALKEYSIIDLRVFNYFSRFQDLNARFFITDIVRAIRSGEVIDTSPDTMIRDFIHPTDFYKLIDTLVKSPPQNSGIDCYSLEPIAKNDLLEMMAENFSLRYQLVNGFAAPVNATGAKPFYYSTYYKAAEFGYVPKYSSREALQIEVSALLSGLAGVSFSE